jgi:hypothetical protein
MEAGQAAGGCFAAASFEVSSKRGFHSIISQSHASPFPAPSQNTSPGNGTQADKTYHTLIRIRSSPELATTVACSRRDDHQWS